jgi:tetratricopeptide (TPR) repeat protein
MFGLEPGEPAGPAIERARLEQNLAALDRGLVPRLPLLAPAVRVPIPDNALTTPLEPELRAELLRSLLLDALRRRADRAPLVLVLEDCHWIDPLSLELLETLGRAVFSLPVLLVVSYRPIPAERSPIDWAAGLPHLTQLRLGPLTDDDVTLLVETRLRSSFGWTTAVPRAVVELATRADGNPFYLEETINLLRDRGIDLAEADAVAGAAIPDTLAGVVMARIDRLGEREKTTLKVASVIGRSFRDAWVWGSSPELGGERVVGASLDHLTRVELTAVASLEPEPEHVFRHVTTRDVAYESLSHSVRQELHSRIGSHVEQTYADALDRYVDTLAHRFGESADADKQRTYFRRAGEQARATYANASALDYYSRLLPLLEGHERREVLLALGQVREHVGDWQGAEEAYRTALHLAEEDVDRRDMADSRRALGALLAYQRSPAEGREQLERALTEFESEHDPDGIVRTLEGLGYAAWKQSDYEASLEYSAKHLRRAELAADAVGISMAVGQIGLAHWARGEHDLARLAFERARDTAAAAGNARGTIHAGNDLAGLQWERGDFAGALEGVRASLAAAEEIGYRHAVAVLTGNAAEIYRSQGELESALALSSRALDLLAELGDSVGVCSQLGNLAITLGALERRHESEELFDLAIGLARAVDSPYFLCEYLHESALLLTGLGRDAEAAARNGEALAVAREISRGDVLAPAELLDVSLRLSLATLTEAEAAVELELLLAARLEPAGRAAAIFELWRTTGREEHRAAAASLYRDLHAGSPLAAYREQYLSLTGEALESPAPPPRLSDELGDVNAATVLARAGEIAAAARGAAQGDEPGRA